MKDNYFDSLVNTNTYNEYKIITNDVSNNLKFISIINFIVK